MTTATTSTESKANAAAAAHPLSLKSLSMFQVTLAGKAVLGRATAALHFNGIGVERSTATAVTLFFGEPSITLSE